MVAVVVVKCVCVHCTIDMLHVYWTNLNHNLTLTVLFYSSSWSTVLWVFKKTLKQFLHVKFLGTCVKYIGPFDVFLTLCIHQTIEKYIYSQMIILALSEIIFSALISAMLFSCSYSRCLTFCLNTLTSIMCLSSLSSSSRSFTRT